ncbi:helix-turn-helix domain-containing protein [Flavobacterium sp.]|uniref:helix-turn-helix domain-containing protein n=1 Tax=Flavobacterium sp. TaxID=239 RepID=UPI003750E04E
MEIKFFKPKSKLLQNYIEGYYFLTKKVDEPSVKYLTFPNNYSIISVFEKIKVEYSENNALLFEDENSPFSSNLICHYKKPIQLQYNGFINEITFYFKPLGLNAFLEKPLSNYTSNFFSNFIPFDDYENEMRKILNENDLESRQDLIENYWLTKVLDFKHPFLKDVILDLSNLEKEHSIDELAKKYNTSRQNLSKHFEIHLCKTPSEFKKVHRFREALKVQINKTSKNNYTSLSYDMLFYDQSHLIKDFKSLTGLTPKTFFKNITSQENGKVNWLFGT